MAHESEKDLAPAGGQMPPAPPRNGFAVSLRSPGAKFLMIGFISMVLLVPLLLVWALTESAPRGPRMFRAVSPAAGVAIRW